MAGWFDRYRQLNETQRRDFDVVMAVTDYQLYRTYNGNCLNANGGLLPQVAKNREDAAMALLTEIENGANLVDTFPELQGGRSRSAAAAAKEITELPDFGDADNPIADDVMVDLYRDSMDGLRVVPPFSMANRMQTVAAAYGLDMNADSLWRAANLVSDVDYYNGSGERKLYIKTLIDDGESFIKSYGSPHFEAYLTNKVVARTNEWLIGAGTHMSMSQAQGLREAIRFAPYSSNIEAEYAAMFDHVDAQGNPVEGKVESYLRGIGVMPPLAPDERPLAEAVARDRRFDLYDGLLEDYDKMRRNGLQPVDVFGTKPSETFVTENNRRRQVVQPVIDFASVRPFVTGDRHAQSALAGLDEEGARAHVPFTFSSDDMLAAHRERDGSMVMLHYKDGAVISPSGERTVLSARAVASASPDFKGQSVGPYMTGADEAGITSLRKYLRSENQDILNMKVSYTENRFNDAAKMQSLQLMSIENAHAILDYMQEQGIQYELQADERAGQIRARMSNGMDVRLVDVAHPEMVGRVYGDNLVTTIQTARPLSADNVTDRSPRLFKAAGPGGTEKAVYMPSPSEAVMPLAARLGREQELPPVGNTASKVGSRSEIVVGQNPRWALLGNKRVNQSWQTNSNSMQVINVQENAYLMSYRGRQARGDMPVCLSTQQVASARVVVPEADQAQSVLQGLIEQARSNFQAQVFGQINERIANLRPEYQKTEWVSYRRDPDTGEKLLDENGEPIVWRRSKRSQALLNTAGKPVEGYDIELSDDPAVRALQEGYIQYLKRDDAMLRGIRNGELVDESREEFSARIQEAISYDALFEDGYGDSDAVSELMSSLDSLFDTEAPTQEEKLAHLQEHFLNYSKEMFGGISDDGTLRVNVGSLKKYGGVDDATLSRLLQSAGTEFEIEPIGADVSDVQRMRERMITFDAESARSIKETKGLSPFMRKISTSLTDSLNSAGCTVNEMAIDKNGIIQYTVTRNTQMQGVNTESFTGQIGQIFEPDSRGVIVTNYAHGENRSIIPRYEAYVTPGEGSVESRTVLTGAEDRIAAAAAQAAKTQALKAIVDKLPNGRPVDPLGTTVLNSVYRSEDGIKGLPDYMAELEGRGLTREQAERYVKTMHDSVRFDTSMMEASLSAEKKAKNSVFVDDRNADPYSILGRRAGDIAACERGYFDLYATSGARSQGLTMFLVEGTSISEDGHIIPAPDGNTRCPMTMSDEWRYVDFNPFVRNQMSFSNAVHSRYIDSEVNVAHITAQGWEMNDGCIISKDYANRHLLWGDEDADPSCTKLLDPAIIELNLKEAARMDSDGVWRQRLLGRDFDIDQDSDLSVGEQIKASLIKDGVALRPMTFGDKISDFNGNKGVICLVVDRDMDMDLAKELEVDQLVALYKLNPELDVISSPFAGISRQNGGTIRTMMENPRDLILPNGEVLSGVIGTAPYIVSDNTVDHKSHIYDDEALMEGKGRKASSQLAWSVQSRGCSELMDFFYKDNVGNMRAIREKLITIGLDFDEDYQFRFGYEPHTLSDGTKEDRPRISLDTDLIELKTQETSKGVSYRSSASAKAAADDLVQQLMAHGGMLEVPFEIKMPTGYPCEKDPETGKYLLPVLPIEYRMDKSYENDGSISSQNFNRYYKDIAREIAAYETEAKIQSLAGGEVNVDVAKSQAAQRTAQERAQRAYDTMTGGIISREFEGKYNIWKSKAMSHRLPDSATLVLTADPRLDINQIGIDAETARSMKITDGSYGVIWRDPLIRENGLQVFQYVYRHPAEGGRKDMSINPGSDNPFDADHDGDTTAPKGLAESSTADTCLCRAYDMCRDMDRSRDMTQEAAADCMRQASLLAADITAKEVEWFERCGRNPNPPYSDRQVRAVGRFYEINDRLHEAYYDTQGSMSKTLLEASGTKPGAFKKMYARYQADNARTEAILPKMDFRNRIIDFGETPRSPKSVDDIVLVTNKDLNIASGAAAMRAAGNTSYDDAVSRCKEKLLESAATGSRDAQMEAFESLNASIKTALKQSLASDYMQYDSDAHVFDGFNRMIEHKAKGKLSAMEDVAVFLNAELSYECDAEGEPVRLDTANCIIRKGDEGVSWTQPEPEGLTFEQKANRAAYVRAAEAAHSGSVNATSIKSEGTGLYGSYSQRMVLAGRDLVDQSGVRVMDAATQVTRAGTQSNISSGKKDAAKAEQNYNMVDNLTAIYRGQVLEHTVIGSKREVVNGLDGTPHVSVKPVEGWRPKMGDDGKPVYHKTAKEWAKNYREIVDAKDGLDVSLSQDNIDILSRGLFSGKADKYGQPTMLKLYGDDVGSTLDRLAYRPRFETMMSCAKEGRRLFDTEQTAMFRPSEPVAKPTMKVLSGERVDTFSVEARKEAQEQKRLERDAARTAAKIAGVQTPAANRHSAQDIVEMAMAAVNAQSAAASARTAEDTVSLK